MVHEATNYQLVFKLGIVSDQNDKGALVLGTLPELKQNPRSQHPREVLKCFKQTKLLQLFHQSIENDFKDVTQKWIPNLQVWRNSRTQKWENPNNFAHWIANCKHRTSLQFPNIDKKTVSRSSSRVVQPHKAWCWTMHEAPKEDTKRTISSSRNPNWKKWPHSARFSQKKKQVDKDRNPQGGVCRTQPDPFNLSTQQKP